MRWPKLGWPPSYRGRTTKRQNHRGSLFSLVCSEPARSGWRAGLNDPLTGPGHCSSESPEAKYISQDCDSSPSYFFTHSKHDGFEFWYLVPLPEPEAPVFVVNAPYISCKTRRAWLYPGERIPTVSEPPLLFSHRDGRGGWVGAWSHSLELVTRERR